MFIKEIKRISTKLVDLPEVIVEESKETESILFVTASSNKKEAVCPRCGKTSRRLHQNHSHLFKDLPMGNKEVILKVIYNELVIKLMQLRRNKLPNFQKGLRTATLIQAYF